MSRNFALNKLKSSMNKNIAISIALILLLTMSSSLAILPTAKAALGSPWPYSSTPTKGTNGLWNLPTFPGVTVSPDPVGVGQPVQVILIIELLPPSTGVEAVTTTTGGWIGLVLTITKPDNTTVTMGPYETDVSGTYQIAYTPDTVGTYYFQMHFPGQTVNGTGFGSYYGNFLASTSDKVSLTVQQAPVTGFNEAPVPLPTQYWTSPINAQNRYWNSISGPWLIPSGFFGGGYNGTGTFNPYTYAPASAHILWAKTLETNAEGIAGGTYGSQQFGEQNSVTSGFTNPIVMGGYVYYDDAGNNLLDNNNGTVVSSFSCMDLRTGQIVWTVPGAITDGQIIEWRSQQQKSTLPYLWNIPGGFFGPGAGPWQVYDARTGTLLAQWGNIPAGHAVAAGYTIPAVFAGAVPIPAITPTDVSPMGGTIALEQPNPTIVGQTIGGAQGGGALLVYVLGSNPGAPTAWLACWNSTLAINSYCNDPVVWNFGGMGGYFPSMEQQQTTPLDWNWGIMWNITFPNPTYMAKGYGGVMPATWSVLGADGDYVILTSATSNPADTGTQSFLMAGINVANQPMTTTWTMDIGGDTQHVTAGTLAWEENISIPAYDQTYGGGSLQNGLIVFADATTQTITAYDESTGHQLWSSTPFNNDFTMQAVSGGTAAYGMLYDPGYDGYMHAINATTGVQMWDSITRPGGLEMPVPGYPASGAFVADQEVFTSTSKAYEAQPLYRGHCLYAYDATTGAQNWNISGEFSISAIADGILIGVNAYDGRVYAFNRGLTATTVSAPQTSITSGSSVIIQGTVTDQTPTSQAQGTPAISDAWMTPWMEYLYMDQPYPSGATGVPVSIDAVDPNGNFVHIGNATSDITGTYIYQWTPPNIPGTYTIIASFSADNSYYGSSGETGAVVVSPTATVAPTATPTSVADMYFVPAIAGLFAVIIIVAIVLALLMLRKRP